MDHSRTRRAGLLALFAVSVLASPCLAQYPPCVQLSVCGPLTQAPGAQAVLSGTVKDCTIISELVTLSCPGSASIVISLQAGASATFSMPNTATCSVGGDHTYVVTATATTNTPPAAVISQSITPVCTSSSPPPPTFGNAAALGSPTVTFSASAPGATFWVWDFGDGSPTANGQTVTHQFTTVPVCGTTSFTVALTTYTACGFAYVPRTIAVSNYPCKYASPLPPLSSDPTTQSLEAGNLDYNDLSPAMKTAYECFLPLIGSAATFTRPMTFYRTPEYQGHLVKVWKNRQKLMGITDCGCQLIKAEADAEYFVAHAPMGQPAMRVSQHELGEAFDLTVLLPPGMSPSLIDQIASQCGLVRPVKKPQFEPWHFERLLAPPPSTKPQRYVNPGAAPVVNVMNTPAHVLQSPPTLSDSIVVTVARTVFAPDSIGYSYTVTNHSLDPIYAVYIGYDGTLPDSLATPQLAVGPKGAMSDTVLVSGDVVAPSGWSAETIPTDNDTLVMLAWHAASEQYEIQPGTSRSGFVVTAPRADITYQNASWTTFMDAAARNVRAGGILDPSLVGVPARPDSRAPTRLELLGSQPILSHDVLKYRLILAQSDPNVTVSLITIAGRVQSRVFRGALSSGSHELQADLGALQVRPGVYLLVARWSDGTIARRVVLLD